MPDKVYALAFGAHPDDVELACGATLLKIIGEGKRVAVCDLTRGEMGTSGSAETRRAEASQATKVMGYSFRETLDLGDAELDYNRENLHSIIRIVRHYRPDVVFLNPPDERHPDHMKGSRLVYDACYYSGLLHIATLRDGTEQLPHRPSQLLYYIQFKQPEADIIVDVSESFEPSRAGIMAFNSQFRSSAESGGAQTMINRREFLPGLEARARALGLQIGALYGEGFLLPGPLALRSFSPVFPAGEERQL